MEIKTYKTLSLFLEDIEINSKTRFIFSRKLSYQSGNQIFINMDLPYDVKIWLIAWEFSHIVRGTNPTSSYYSTDIDQGDKDAYKMLKLISANKDEKFSFDKLIATDVFAKVAKLQK